MAVRSVPLSLLVTIAAWGGAGCTVRNDYPSLAPRPIEGISLAEPAARPGPPSLPPAEAAARYAPLLDHVRESDVAFTRALDAERATLAHGRAAAVGSDEWGAAQQAYTRVAAKRGEVTQAVSSLQSATETPETETDPALSAAARRALDEAEAIDGREAAALREVAPRAA